MELRAGSIVAAAGPQDEHTSRWEVIESVQTTRLRRSYLARSRQPEWGDHRVLLTVCRYNAKLLGKQEYVDNVRRRLLHEAQMLTIEHNALPEPVDLFVMDNDQDVFTFEQAERYQKTEPVLVTEALHGKPLDTLGVLPEGRALRLVRKIADFLVELHEKGFIAYELRPEDILADPLDHDRVWIGSCANYQSTRAGVVQPSELVVPLSDFAFTAPEVEAGLQPLDCRCDLYSLGALLLYLLTGQRVPEATLGNGFVSSPELQPETARLLGRCLATYPKLRFSSAEELLAALDDAICGLAHPSPPRISELTAELTQGKIVVRWKLPEDWGSECGLALMRWKSGGKPPPDVALWKVLLDELPSSRVSWEEGELAPGETWRYALVSQQQHGDYRKRAHPALASVEIPESWMARMWGALWGRAKRA